MTSGQRLRFRNNLLIQLSESLLTTPVHTLVVGAKADGFRVEEEDVLRELRYLVSKELAIETKEEVSAGVRCFQTSAQGIEYLEGKGLI